MKPSFTRIIAGAIIALLGLGMLAANLGILDVSMQELWRTWWPVLVIVGGALIFINNTKNYLWALLVITMGVLWQLQSLDIITVNPWQVFWPLVIVAVGLSLVLRPDSRSKYSVSKKDQDDVTAIMGGSDKKYTSNNFVGTTATVIMGGNKLDLRKATIKKQAVISATVIMGGLEIIVPRNIHIRNETNAILGGVEDKSDQEVNESAPTLVVSGDVVLGGIEIKN